MKSRRALFWIRMVLALCLSTRARAQEEEGERRAFVDLRVRSSADSTEIRLAVPQSIKFEDRTKLQPGNVTVDEIRLFFPRAKIERSRLVTVSDRIVEETRLFPEEGGVTMTVVVRRPVTYTIERPAAVLRLKVQPSALFAEEPAPGQPPGVAQAPVPREPRPRRVRPGDEGRLEVPAVKLQELQPREGLSVNAENITYDQEKNQIVATGRVTIARAGSLLTADEVRVDRDTRVGEAIGNVQLADPQGTIRASRFRLNLEDETGELIDGDAFLNASQISITGSKFEKSYGQTYHIENGRFTTCQCGAGEPTWSIAGDEIDVTLDGYGIVRGAKFQLFDVPVFYLPVAGFPAKVTRQTGLLAPIVGYSKKRGFTYTQPLYVVLNKSADATLSFDIETEARIGGIAEYRYALGTDSRGDLNAAFFDEGLRNNAERDIVNDDVADPDIPDQRWSVTSDVRQNLGLGVTGFVDALAVSDDFFLREIPTFSFDPDYERTLRTSRYTSTRGGIYRTWERATVIAQAIYFQDFIQEDDLTLQRLPEVSLFGSERVFDRRVKLRLRGEAVNFVRDEGFDGPRFDISPQAELPFHWKEYLRGSVGVAFRETAYSLDETEVLVPISQAGGVQDPSASPTQLEDSNSRELFIGGANVGTELNRIFDIGGETVKKLKHTIEPGVEYLYVPDVEQDDLPLYDFTDRITARNLVTYGVTSRLLAKLAQAPARMDQPLSAGEINAFTGVAPAPFDDERTRTMGGYMPADEVETPSATVPPETGEAELSIEALAEREREEKEALSNVVEWGRVEVFQSYDFDEPIQTRRSATGTEEGDNYSDVDVAVRITPGGAFSLLYDSSINAKDGEFSSNRVGFVLRDPRPRQQGFLLESVQRAAIGLSYRFIAGDVLEEVDGSLFLPLADSVSAFYQTRYDALGTEFLENRGGFRLLSQCKCWIFDLSVADRINPNETELRAQLTLVGLGSIGRAR